METRGELVLELSREPFEIEQICEWLKCATRWDGQSINRVFPCNSPGSQVVVADVINGWRVMETHWDLVLELSREPFEIEQICQWLECAPRRDEQSINRVYHCKSPESQVIVACAPRWEEQPINRVFHSNSPGSQVIVADVINWWRVMETPWELVLELSREPFEIEQICQ